MSGHSKWATIHRAKEVKDSARGKLFSKFSRGITIAAKSGGTDPDSNFRLRDAIEKARASNMPKENIDRAISKASGAADVEEVTYEGFGPSGIAILIEAATDNRNRTSQELKNIFEKAGGTLAGPGAVAFNFKPVGFILVKKSDNIDEQTLNLIDLGISDLEVTKEGIECETLPKELYVLRQSIEEAGHQVLASDLIQKPINYQKVEDHSLSEKIMQFLELLEDHDDVQKVFTNADFV